jgi:hypothetical protein
MKPAEIQQVIAQWNVLRATATNLHDIRLLFRWPVLAGVTNNEPRIGKRGPQIYRTLASGSLVEIPLGQQINGYLFQPTTYQEVNQP